jgi:hypothetical protein
MYWRDVRRAAVDFLPEPVSWLARYVVPLYRTEQTAEEDQRGRRPGQRIPAWEDPWIDLGGEG